MTVDSALADGLQALDSLDVAVLTDDVSDNYVSKTPFAVSEFSNVVRHGARVLSGEALLCANLGFGLRLVSNVGGKRHTLLFDTGPEGAVFIRNCAALGIALGEVEAIAVTHGHWDHMAALPVTIDKIVAQGGRVAVHVNPGMFNDRAIRLSSGIVPVAKVPLPADMEGRGATVVNSAEERLLLDGHFYYSRESLLRPSELRCRGEPSVRSRPPAPARGASAFCEIH
jgi:7,8-dihydropterin-6-yl-methyl-4-(beta-D-ribofuranosyl)aminobenzene 5'-phosphate synthase